MGVNNADRIGKARCYQAGFLVSSMTRVWVQRSCQGAEGDPRAEKASKGTMRLSRRNRAVLKVMGVPSSLTARVRVSNLPRLLPPPMNSMADMRDVSKTTAISKTFM